MEGQEIHAAPNVLRRQTSEDLARGYLLLDVQKIKKSKISLLGPRKMYVLPSGGSLKLRVFLIFLDAKRTALIGA